MTAPVSGAVASTPLPDGVTPAFARSVRFWSRAYPRRWRAARGDEPLGLLADLATPGAQRLDARTALDLVRGGWATRVREHPPLGPWLLYRLFGRRSLPDHLAWVADDIAGVLFPLRYALWPLVVFVLLDTWRVATGLTSFFSRPVVWVALAGVLALDLLSGRDRTRAMEAQLTARPGERVRPGMWVRVRAARRRLAARDALPWLAVATGVLLTACVVGTVLAPDVTWGDGAAPAEQRLGAAGGTVVPRTSVLVVLGVAVVVGAVLAWLAHVRLHRLAPVPQPDRELVGLGARRRLGLVLVVGLLGAAPVAEAVGAAPLAASLPIGLIAGVLAPPTLASWLALRRSASADGELALVDVRGLALLGRPPRVDPPGSSLGPAQASEIGEVRPWPWSNESPTTALG